MLRNNSRWQAAKILGTISRHIVTLLIIKEVFELRISLLIFMFVYTIFTTAFAAPSSILWIPSTDIQPSDKTNFGIGVTTGAPTVWDYGLTWGKGNFEFGLDYIAPQTAPFLFNAKYKLFGKKPADLNVVAGIYNVGTTRDTNQEVKYLLGSASTNDGTRFSLGYGIGRTEALGNSNQFIFAGIDKQLNDNWWIAVDYQSGTSALGAFNFGFSYKTSPSTTITIFYDIYNNKDINNTTNVHLDVSF
jgi:hypothetical protein